MEDPEMRHLATEAAGQVLDQVWALGVGEIPYRVAQHVELIQVDGDF